MLLPMGDFFLYIWKPYTYNKDWGVIRGVWEGLDSSWLSPTASPGSQDRALVAVGFFFDYAGLCKVSAARNGGPVLLFFQP